MTQPIALVGLSHNNLVFGLRLIIFKDHVSNERKAQVYSMLGNVQLDFRVVLESCKPTEIQFVDYIDDQMQALLQKWGICNINFLDKDSCTSISKTVYTREKLSTFLDYLKAYNTGLLFNPVSLLSCSGFNVLFDVAPKSYRYIYINGVPFCTWSPKIQKIKSTKDLNFSVVDNILWYKYSEEIYILQQLSARHRLVNIGEELTINVVNGLCLRSISYIENNYYFSKTFRFDTTQGTWALVKQADPIKIDGFKKK